MGVDYRAEKQNMTSDTDVVLVRSDGEKRDERRGLLGEHPLELWVSERLLERLVCTPDDLENLVVGRLVTEQVISCVEEIEQLYLCEGGCKARVFLKKDVKFEPAEAMAENGGPKQPSFPKLPQTVWKKEWIFSIIQTFAEDSKLHRSTGGTHSCMLAMEGQVLYCAEDLGRHNAMDKAIGYAARQGLDREKCILFTTGRVPTDMVRKAVAARIPVLVSKAVPTAQAVEMAQESGLTLICRAWPDSFEVYAGEA